MARPHSLTDREFYELLYKIRPVVVSLTAKASGYVDEFIADWWRTVPHD
jgi:hypothetical protein